MTKVSSNYKIQMSMHNVCYNRNDITIDSINRDWKWGVLPLIHSKPMISIVVSELYGFTALREGRYIDKHPCSALHLLIIL